MLGSTLTFGFLLGVRHALDADHVAAVAALATGTSSLRGMCRLAAGWGTGHTVTILVLGSIAVALGASLPEGSAMMLERTVGVALVLLGLDVLRRGFERRAHVHVHHHEDGQAHLHLHVHEADTHDHDHAPVPVTRALAMGTLHGMAGSAALLLLVLPGAGSALEAIATLAVFGIGSVAGMLVFSMALACPLRLATRGEGTMVAMEGVLATVTILVGASIVIG